MSVELISECEVDSGEDEGNHESSEGDMRNEDGIVDVAHDAFAVVGCDTGEIVVVEVGGEKGCGGGEGTDHEVSVQVAVIFLFDGDPAGQEEEGGDGVERRVDRGEVLDRHEMGFSRRALMASFSLATSVGSVPLK